MSELKSKNIKQLQFTESWHSIAFPTGGKAGALWRQFSALKCN